MKEGREIRLITLSRPNSYFWSDEIAMEAPLSAPRPRQVSHITCGFAGPTSGPVARSHRSLD